MFRQIIISLVLISLPLTLLYGYDSDDERILSKHNKHKNNVSFSGKTGGMNFIANLSNGILKFSAEGAADMGDPRISNYSQARNIAVESAKLILMKNAAIFLSGITLSYMAEVDYMKLMSSKISAGFTNVHVKHLFDDTLYFVMEKDPAGRDVPVAHLHMACVLYDSENPARSAVTSMFGTFVKSLPAEKYENYIVNDGVNSNDINNKYTCVVIDIGNLDFAPVMFPIVTVKGNSKQIVYSGSKLSKEMVGKYGTACYISNVANGKKQDRLSNNGQYNPLIIKATNTSGRYHGNIQVSKSDATKMYNANLNSNIMDEGRVAILIK